jgi:hypothetical protein
MNKMCFRSILGNCSTLGLLTFPKLICLQSKKLYFPTLSYLYIHHIKHIQISLSVSPCEIFFLSGPHFVFSLDCCVGQRHACIDLCHGTPFSLAWLVADGNLSERGLARLIGSVYKKDCILLYCCSTDWRVCSFCLME